MSRLRAHGALSGKARTSTPYVLGVQGVARVEEGGLAVGADPHPGVVDRAGSPRG